MRTIRRVSRLIPGVLGIWSLFACKARTDYSATKSDQDPTPAAGETAVQSWDPIVDDDSGSPVLDTFAKMSALCAVPKPDVDPPNWRLPTLSEVTYLARVSDRFAATFNGVTGIWVSDQPTADQAASNPGLTHLAWTAGLPVPADDSATYDALCVAAR